MNATYPIYYKYPGDGYNRWKVIVQTAKDRFVGTHRIYSNGILQDPVDAHGIYHADPAWEVINLMEAVILSNT